MKTLNYQDAKMLKYWNGKVYGTVIRDYRLDLFGERINTILPEFLSCGLLRVTTGYENVENYAVPDLKQVLKDHELSTTGKKADLVERVRNNIPSEELSSIFKRSHYMLTENGKNALDFFELFFLNDEYNCGFMSEELAEAKQLFPDDNPLEQLRRMLLRRFSKEYANRDPKIFTTCRNLINVLKKKNDYQNMLLYLWTFTSYEMSGCSYIGRGEYYVYTVRFPLSAPHEIRNFDLCKSALGWTMDEFCNHIRNKAFPRTVNMPFSFFTNEELLKVICDILTGNAKPITPQNYLLNMPIEGDPNYIYYSTNNTY